MRDCPNRKDDCVEVAACPFQLERLTRDLARREKRLLDFWNHAHDILCIIDHGGVFRSVSPSCAALLGYAPSSLEGQTFLSFVHPDDTETGARLFRAHPVRVRFRHEDGHYVELEWCAGTTNDGSVCATARVVRDLAAVQPHEVPAPRRIRAS